LSLPVDPLVPSVTRHQEDAMHKVIVAQFVSLDGVTEDPDGSGGTPFGGWAFRYGPGPVAGDKFRMGEVLETGLSLLGRTTWELFATIFSPRDDEFSRQLTSMPKLVASRSLEDADRWANSTLLRGELCDAVAERVQHQDVMVTGSASIVDQLIARDMVDEFRLMVFPIVLGKGRRLFGGASAPIELELVSSEDAGSGVLRQIYTRK
jgi:dihydrofolate reductase